MVLSGLGWDPFVILAAVWLGMETTRRAEMLIWWWRVHRAARAYRAQYINVTFHVGRPPAVNQAAKDARLSGSGRGDRLVTSPLPGLCTHASVCILMGMREMPLREARAKLGDLAEAAHHGETIILTKHGRPYARLAPLEDTVTEIPEHFTAWITTDTSALDQACADVVVLADELQGEPDDPNPWSSTGEPLFSAATTVDAAEGDIEDAMREAEELLAAAGWTKASQWESVPTGCIVTVERA
jgi:prevent-host-death family protein